MATKEEEDTRSGKGSKSEDNNSHQNNIKITNNDNKKNDKIKSKPTEGKIGTAADNQNPKDEPELLIVPSSSADDSQQHKEEEVHEIVEEDEKKDIETSLNKKKEKNSNKEMYNFPMNRVSVIIKSEYSDIRITQEAIFLINKASEKFLELFTKEAYACAFLDRKSQISYSHLSSVVCKRKRFDFLSDFVPEKVKAADALAEMLSQFDQADT